MAPNGTNINKRAKINRAVHDLRVLVRVWGNLTPIETASTRGSPQTKLTGKNEIPSRWPFRNLNWLILNVVNETEFLFSFSSGRWTATSARGVWVMVEPEIVSEALKIDVASLLPVQGLNILVGLCTTCLSFDAYPAIIWQYWVKIS